MKEITIINNNIAIKDAFGDFSILNKVEIVDHPALYEFAIIVSNYKKMIRLNGKTKENTIH